MPSTGHPSPPTPIRWQISVWLNDGTKTKAALLASAVVDDLEQARTYAEQTAGTTLRSNPEAYVWVEAWPGHRPSRRTDWIPIDGPCQVAVFDETHSLGLWLSRDIPSGPTEQQ